MTSFKAFRGIVSRPGRAYLGQVALKRIRQEERAKLRRREGRTESGLHIVEFEKGEGDE